MSSCDHAVCLHALDAASFATSVECLHDVTTNFNLGNEKEKEKKIIIVKREMDLKLGSEYTIDTLISLYFLFSINLFLYRISHKAFVFGIQSIDGHGLLQTLL